MTTFDLIRESQAGFLVPKAVLLDLGGVVLGIKWPRFLKPERHALGSNRRPFQHNWIMDEAYEAAKTGDIDFVEYARRQAQHLLDIHKRLASGWNAIWTEPYAQVVSLLPNRSTVEFTHLVQCRTCESFLKVSNALAHFNTLFLSHEIGVRKPHPQAFRYICDLIDIQPQEVLFIDDNADNINGARAAGLDAHHLQKESDIAQKLRRLLA